jgi:hypothetical protein
MLESTNNVEYEFWTCHDDIKGCVKGNKKKYMVDWLIIHNTWQVKISTNTSKEEVLVFEDTRFQLE